MSAIDWIVLLLTVSIIVGYGMWRTKGSKNIDGYLLGGNEAKWWTVGLSVMATQASAITFLSTPGQAYHDGMGFAQFYFMLPIAMIIICITFIPLFYKLKVYTAYEFLENRFDLKTRSLTSILFLIQRGLATGITIYAPAIIISSVMHWRSEYDHYNSRCHLCYIHDERRDKSRSCHSQTSNDRHPDWLVHHIFYFAQLYNGRLQFHRKPLDRQSQQ